MSAVLLRVLERPELNKIPKAAQNKLEKFLTDVQNENDSLKIQHERFKADCEQQYFDVEKRLAESLEQIVAHTRDVQTLKEQNRILSEELSSLKGVDVEPVEEKPVVQTKARYEIEAERRELARLLEKKSQEVENLSEDVKRLNDKLQETNSAKVELQLRLDEIQSAEVSIQHREKRVEQEKELLQTQSSWLSSELQNKTDQLLAISRETGGQLLELRCSLETSQKQVTRLKGEVSSLQQSSEAHQKRAEDLLTKLKECKDQQSVMEEKFNNELNSHIKLSNLYKTAASDSEKKNEELGRAVEELSTLLKQSGDANKVLEKKLSEVEGLKERREAELQEEIRKMEMENANIRASDKSRNVPTLTEEELDSMCPTAAAVAKIVKPGMKFMELYNAFVAAQDQLQQEQQESRRVSRVLDDIVLEVESKAPVLRRQREEYENMRISMSALCTKLEQARGEIHQLQKEREEARQRCSTLEREHQRTRGQLEDTCQQVRVLLVELEESRGNQVVRDDGSSAAITSSSEVISPRRSGVISPRLLEFRSVEELQQQNQSILGRLRELEEQRDGELTLATSKRVEELQSSLQQAQEEVQRLQEQSSQHKQLADSSTRQRDMYSILLSQTTGLSLPQLGPAPAEALPSTGPALGRPAGPAPATRSTPVRAAAAESAQTTQAKAALKQLNDAFTTYKKEKAENDRMLSEANDRLQLQLSQLRSQKAKLSSQLEFNSKRYEMLQETVSAYRRQMAALQEQSHKMAATEQSHEQIIHTLTQDLRAANEKLALAEVRVESLQKEKTLLKQAEGRLVQEKEAMLAEQRNQNLLLTNLKSIQLTMERADAESCHRLHSQIQRLETELSLLKTKLDQELEQRHALGRSHDAQLMEAKKQLETQNALHQKTKDLLKTTEQQVSALKLQLSQSEASAQTPTPGQGRAPVRGPGPAAQAQAGQQTVAQVQTKVRQLEREVEEVRGRLRQEEEQSGELKERLQNASTNVEQYRSLVLSLEENLNTEKQARIPVETRLKEAQEVTRQLERKLLEAEKEKQEVEEEKRKAVGNVEKEVSELTQRVKSMQADLQGALERASAAVTQEQKATQDSVHQARLASEAQSKYERELMLHASDVEALQAAKRQSQQGAAERRLLEDRTQKASAQLQEGRNAWTLQEKKIKEDLSNQERRVQELQKQNSLLHQQLEELGAKMAAAVKQSQAHHGASHAGLALSPSEEGKSLQQVLDILRFVRRQQEIAEARVEVAEGEALRFRQQLEMQHTDTKELQDSLNTERLKMQATAKTLAQQDEKMRRMESVNVLADTNKMLKQERERLEQELQQTQAKVRKLEADISPIQKSNSDLSEKNRMLLAEKKLLDDDLKHWKTRSQQLLSQQKDSDQEENRKLSLEREAQLKRIQQLSEETARLKAELARSAAAVTSGQAQAQALRESAAKLTSERDALKKDLQARTNDILEKNKTITQVKKIGRRYKTQYDELKVLHDKMLEEKAARPAPSKDSQEEEEKEKEAQQELSRAKEEARAAKEEAQQKAEQLQQAQKEVQQSKEQLQSVQKEVQQKAEQLQSVQKEVQQKSEHLLQAQKDAQQSKEQLQGAQKEAQQKGELALQAQKEAQQSKEQLQALQKENKATRDQLQQIKDQVQQNKEQHQQSQVSSAQEVSGLNASLSHSQAKIADLEGQLDSLQKSITEREAEVRQLQERLNQANQASQANQQANQASQANQANQQANPASQPPQASEEVLEELSRLRQEVRERSSQQEELRQQLADKEDKTKKVFIGAKQKINQLNSANEQLVKEKEDLKAVKEELEVRMNALKSQYEGRLQRQERDLRELREHAHTHPHTHPHVLGEQREEPQEQVQDQQRALEPRHVSLKTPASDRGSSCSSDPPTANIRPTSVGGGAQAKPAPSPGNKPTPRASIRPMVTPATISMPTPTATVMPTTQAESQEVFGSASSSVRSTSPSVQTSQQPISSLAQSQATAFVQPTQQQTNQEAAAGSEAGPSSQVERPSTSSAVISPGGGGAGPKRTREVGPESSDTPPDDPDQPPSTKKIRIIQRMGLEDDIEEGSDGEMEDPADQSSPDHSQELPEEGFPVLAEEEEDEEGGVSQSVPCDHVTHQEEAEEPQHDVIVIDTDSESREEGEEEEEEDAERYEGEDGEEVDGGEQEEGEMGAEESTQGSGETYGGEEEEEEAGPDMSEDNEESLGASDSAHRQADAHSGDGSSSTSGSVPPVDPPRLSQLHPPTPSPSLEPRLPPRLPQSPRRPPLPPRLYIQPPAPELGPPHTQRQQAASRRQSVGRGPQLTPGIGSMQHFFDDDDRMVPSTPTLVVPHRTDGFAEAIHSPQVAGVPRFRFGPPDDIMQQASSSHSDLGQLASQGGLGMYESPLFLAAHDEEAGGRSVPTTPLQVTAPVTMFTESHPSDTSDMASQSVPMVTTSTGGLAVPGDDGDEVFMEGESEGTSGEASLESQGDSAAQPDDASQPSTSQEPDTSSGSQPRSSGRPLTQLPPRQGARGGRTLIRRGVGFARAGRGPFGRGNLR
ncbi:nucleoprotein TPR isoform X2 [Osmerus eperlanus]|uniref:nucleoprotein TPR isoform X2 n=1 Tax=Osmerus eperlanus TaxID=29151 RepID=UPI002E12A522